MGQSEQFFLSQIGKALTHAPAVVGNKACKMELTGTVSSKGSSSGREPEGNLIDVLPTTDPALTSALVRTFHHSRSKEHPAADVQKTYDATAFEHLSLTACSVAEEKWEHV